MAQHHMDVDDGGGRQQRVPVDLPSNSYTAKKKTEVPERKPNEKIITGTVVTRKKPFWGALRSSFVSEDAPTVGRFIVEEVLLPAVKNMIADGVSEGAQRFLFGESRPRSGSPVNVVGQSIYNRISTVRTTPRPAASRITHTSHDFDDIILETRVQAETVIDRLRDIIDQYKVATVADLYELTGITTVFTDNKWGWYDLREAAVKSTRHGHMLLLPSTSPITD